MKSVHISSRSELAKQFISFHCISLLFAAFWRWNFLGVSCLLRSELSFNVYMRLIVFSLFLCAHIHTCICQMVAALPPCMVTCVYKQEWNKWRWHAMWQLKLLFAFVVVALVQLQLKSCCNDSDKATFQNFVLWYLLSAAIRCIRMCEWRIV